MADRKTAGIACLILAALFVVVAVKNTFLTPSIPVGDASGLGVSRAVGSFLPSVVVLALAIWLLQKPKT